MDKGAKIEYNTLMRKNEEGVALVRKKSGFENLVLISQLGFNVLTAVFLCVAAGVWADRQFGTSLTPTKWPGGPLNGSRRRKRRKRKHGKRTGKNGTGPETEPAGINGRDGDCYDE